MTDIPEDIYEAGIESLGLGTDSLVETAAVATKLSGAWLGRVVLYGVLSVGVVGTVVAKAAPDLLTPIVDSFPGLAPAATDGG